MVVYFEECRQFEEELRDNRRRIEAETTARVERWASIFGGREGRGERDT